MAQRFGHLLGVVRAFAFASGAQPSIVKRQFASNANRERWLLMTDTSHFFAHRSFYTWDHSTNWDLSRPGQRISGCFETYEKPPEAFLEDYTRLIDFMSQTGMNHLIIWGALRDSHGGVDALRNLIELGRQKGVRVAPGVGVNSYGGVYWEGDHEFNLNRFLLRRPELAALGADGKPMLDRKHRRRTVACPRHPEVNAWHRAAIRWLMEELSPQAIHFETGDYGVCRCERCRQANMRDAPASDADLACALPPLVEEVRRYSHDCLLSYNHYDGYTRRMSANPPTFVTAIPDDVVCKWGVSWMLDPDIQSEFKAEWSDAESMDPSFAPPTKESMAHLHFATGWWNCSPRGTLEIERFFRAFPLLAKVGFTGVCTHGEESELNPSAELNYHVFSALAENPYAVPSEIARRSVADLLGNVALATDVLMAYAEAELPADLPPRVARAAKRARGRQKVRLNWLTFELHRYEDVLRRRSMG